MIKLNQSTPTGGDCTAGYEISFDRPYIVGEFINEVLSKNEWGIINIDGTSLEYKGDILYGGTVRNIAILDVKSAKASGGWGRMDYYIKTSQYTGFEKICNTYGVKNEILTSNNINT